MSIATHQFDYEIDGKTFEAFVASPEHNTAAPGVLVCHAWAGRSDLENSKAEALAELGYTGVAIDLYGKGVLGSSKEENQSLMEPFVKDRRLLQSRMLANIEAANKYLGAGASVFAAIGFCFGGLCVLDLARIGADIKGVVSFHGLLGSPGNTISDTKVKVLALHGWDDPMATPKDVAAFGEEMKAAHADWQLHAYGGTMHAFTNPAANDPGFGTVYNETANRRSWQAMKNFLATL